MAQVVVQDIVPWQDREQQEEEEEYESNEDFDSEGQLILDFEDDAEYSESEALQILAYHTGRAQVRRDLLKDKTNRGFRPPPSTRGRDQARGRDQRSQKKDRNPGAKARTPQPQLSGKQGRRRERKSPKRVLQAEAVPRASKTPGCGRQEEQPQET